MNVPALSRRENLHRYVIEQQIDINFHGGISYSLGLKITDSVRNEKGSKKRGRETDHKSELGVKGEAVVGRHLTSSNFMLTQHTNHAFIVKFK